MTFDTRIESMSQEISDEEIKSYDQCGAQMEKNVTGLVRINVEKTKNNRAEIKKI